MTAVANTFGMLVESSDFHHIRSTADLDRFVGQQRLIVGGCSNILFTADVGTPILHNAIRGVTVERESASHVWLCIGGGEAWHDVVVFCARNDWWGVENLALIPGTVGAAPVQNIGAYGVEIRQCLERVSFVDLNDGKRQMIAASDCEMAYRGSLFKRRRHWFITHIHIRLGKVPRYDLSYRDLAQWFGDSRPAQPADIVQAVAFIRQQKLPDWRVMGNAGSFFRNPTVSHTHCRFLRQQYPELKCFAVEEGYKLSAAQLLHIAGWRGYRDDSYGGVYARHALILVNHGKAVGTDVLRLAKRISKDVAGRFGIDLLPEVAIV